MRLNPLHLPLATYLENFVTGTRGTNGTERTGTERRNGMIVFLLGFILMVLWRLYELAR